MRRELTLLYLAYGSGTYTLEATYSILSSLRFTPSADFLLRREVYTDHPELFLDLPVETVPVTGDQLHTWAGDTGNPFRCKVFLLDDSLQRHRSPVVYLDSDTYFRTNPERLLDKIGPGHAVMHIREGKLASHPGWRDLIGMPTGQSGEGAHQIPSDASMWNAGVIGLHPNDAPILKDTLRLMDALYSPRRWYAEQFSFSYCLAASTILRPVDDVVYHYWDAELREPFLQRLPALLADCREKSISERARECYVHRPSPTATWTVRQSIRGLLELAGILKRRPDVVSSFMPKLRKLAFADS